MFCAACLTFSTETTATAVVAGTEYCSQHAVQALAISTGRFRGPGGPGGPANMANLSVFSPLLTPPTTAPAASAADAGPPSAE